MATTTPTPTIKNSAALLPLVTLILTAFILSSPGGRVANTAAKKVITKSER